MTPDQWTIVGLSAVMLVLHWRLSDLIGDVNRRIDNLSTRIDKLGSAKPLADDSDPEDTSH